MFRDRAMCMSFFPPEGEQQAHQAQFEQTYNLDGYKDDLYPMVKDGQRPARYPARGGDG